MAEALKSADGLYDYLSITLISHKGSHISEAANLASEMGARIDYYFPKWNEPFIDDFSAARNLSIQNVPKDTDWIFILDSDDRVVDPFEARSAIISQSKDVVIMARVQSIKNNNSFMQWRAWPKGAGHFEGRIHNQFTVHEDMDAKYVPAVHITYSDRNFIDRHDRNMAILNDIKDKKPEHYYYMGEMIFLKAKKDKVITELGDKVVASFCEALDRGVEDSLAYRCYYHLADYYAIMASHIKDNAYGKKAIDYIIKMIQTSIYTREPFYLMGRLLASMNKHKHAVVWLQACVDMPQHVTVWHLAKDVKAPAYEQMALSYLSMRMYKKAMSNHAIARLLNKTFESTDHYFDKLVVK